jgi:hypothetical protein
VTSPAANDKEKDVSNEMKKGILESLQHSIKGLEENQTKEQTKHDEIYATDAKDVFTLLYRVKGSVNWDVGQTNPNPTSRPSFFISLFFFLVRVFLVLWFLLHSDVVATNRHTMTET